MIGPGDQVGRYTVEALIGQGGLAQVYRVRHSTLGTRYALKVMALRSASLGRRLIREGQIQAQLAHPNVVNVSDVIEHEGMVGLLMEYVEGTGLDAYLGARGALPIDEALGLFGQILAGVGAAHDAGVLHRDLKPANILLTTGTMGTIAKVTDFGIAKMLQVDAGGDTLQGDLIGTPGYMAPEQVTDATTIDARADVYSMGALLYCMVTGRPPFLPGQPLVELLQAAAQGRFPPVLGLRPDCPPHVAEAIEACLHPDPARRPTGFRALGALLAADAGDLPVAPTHLRSPLAAAPPPAGPTAVPDLRPGDTAPPVERPATPRPPTLGPSTVAGLDDDGPEAPRRRGPALWVAGLGALGMSAFAAALLWPPAAPPPGPPAAEGVTTPPPAEPPPVEPPPADAPPVEPPPAEAPPVEPPPAEPPPVNPGAPAPSPRAAPAVSPGPSPAPAPAPAPAAEPAPAPAPEPAPPPPPAPAPAAAPPPPPPAEASAAPAPAPAAPALPAVLRGKADGRPFTLRVVQQDGSTVVAQIDLLVGTTFRSYPMRGEVSAAGELQLREPSGGWSLSGRVSGGSLTGMLNHPDQKKPLPVRAAPG